MQLMRRIAPLIVSGTSGIGKTAFSARLVNEHPDLFKISQMKQKESLDVEIQEAERENKIPIIETSEITNIDSYRSEIGGTVNGLYIMPPNMQSFRANLEKGEQHSPNTINMRLLKTQEEVEKALKSPLFGDEDFIFHNNDFEAAYQQFKKRVFFFYS